MNNITRYLAFARIPAGAALLCLALALLFAIAARPAIAAPKPDLSIADVTVSEGDSGTQSVSFNITLSAAYDKDISVDYTTVEDSATIHSDDYRSTSGTLTIPAGDSAATLTIEVVGDSIYEYDEQFYVELTNISNATLADAQAIGTITNDDPLPAVHVVEMNYSEGSSGPAEVMVWFQLTNPAGMTVTVDYETADNTAWAGSDYTAISGTLTIPPQSPTQRLYLTINYDEAFEYPETLYINLSNPSIISISDTQAELTIHSDDPMPTLSINDVSLVEGNSGTSYAIFTVTLSGETEEVTTADYYTSSGTAGSADFLNVSGTVRLGILVPGKGKIRVPVYGDTTDEIDEYFRVRLANASNAMIMDGEGIGTIIDDDP